MTKKFNVLIVDDHPLIITCHKNALKQVQQNHPEWQFKIRCATNCDTAIHEIEKAMNHLPFDLVLLDVRLPPSENRSYLSGEDIGVKIRESFNPVKILILTSYNDNYRISNIMQNISPDGFLIKDDIDFNSLVDAIEAIIEDPPYYSKSIMKLYRKQMSNDFVLDQIDRQLLYHLSSGLKTKDLPDIIPLSISGIEHRKRKLKELFDADEKEDSLLLNRAREKGFI